MMKRFSCAFLLLSGASPAAVPSPVPLLQAQAETDPIPAGTTDTDDAAVWVNPENPERSLIFGTSKHDLNAQGGLGVYDLNGRQLQFFAGSKLNSVDIIQKMPVGPAFTSLAIASNRSEKALDFYRIDAGLVSYVGRTALLDESGKIIEPYGLCMAQDHTGTWDAYLPTKRGLLHRYRIELGMTPTIQWTQTINLGALVSPEQDLLIQSNVRKEVTAEQDESKLEKSLKERFILEACTFDVKTQKLYVGMENLGIWSIDHSYASAPPELAIQVQGSWTDIQAWEGPGIPRVTDDIEGLDIWRFGDRSYLIFSSQGISEFTVYDLANLQWKGNFKLAFGEGDPVSETDGVSVQGESMGPIYPKGLLVVHDDENTNDQGQVEPGNYKLISLEQVGIVLDLEYSPL